MEKEHGQNGQDARMPVQAAADLLGVSSKTIWRHMESGKLRKVREGQRVYVSVEEVVSLQAARARGNDGNGHHVHKATPGEAAMGNVHEHDVHGGRRMSMEDVNVPGPETVEPGVNDVHRGQSMSMGDVHDGQSMSMEDVHDGQTGEVSKENVHELGAEMAETRVEHVHRGHLMSTDDVHDVHDDRIWLTRQNYNALIGELYVYRQKTEGLLEDLSAKAALEVKIIKAEAENARIKLVAHIRIEEAKRKADKAERRAIELEAEIDRLKKSKRAPWWRRWTGAS